MELILQRRPAARWGAPPIAVGVKGAQHSSSQNTDDRRQKPGPTSMRHCGICVRRMSSACHSGVPSDTKLCRATTVEVLWGPDVARSPLPLVSVGVAGRKSRSQWHTASAFNHTPQTTGGSAVPDGALFPPQLQHTRKPTKKLGDTDDSRGAVGHPPHCAGCATRQLQ